MNVINNTSVDDIRSSLNLMGTGTPAAIKSDIEYLKRSLGYESKNYNRVSVIKMLIAKIHKLEKLQNTPIKLHKTSIK